MTTLGRLLSMRLPPSYGATRAPRPEVASRSATSIKAHSSGLHLREGGHGQPAAIHVPPPHLASAPPQPQTFFRPPTDDFPKILEVPQNVQGSPEAWGRAARPDLDRALAATPAVVVRGAPSHKPADFRAFLDGVGYPREAYVGSFIDRAVEDGLYDATANPKWFMLTPHNENVFFGKKPNKIIFSMVQPATQGGGETLLQTNEELTLSIGEPLREVFNQRGGVRYTRWYRSQAQKNERLERLRAKAKSSEASQQAGAKMLANLQLATALQMPTQSAWVDSEDPAMARAYFEGLDLQVHFDEGGGLIAWNQLPPTVPGPLGQPSWLNFADYDGIPPYFTVAYGDSTPTESETRRALQRRLLTGCTALALRQGDVILFDNLRCQHGRTPFAGSRKLLVELASQRLRRRAPGSRQRCRP